MIADHADRICGTVPLEGSSGNLELSGSAKAELDGLLKQMARLGIQGTAKYQDSKYQGVLQKDLANAMRDQTNCKMNVNNLLVNRLLPSAVPGWSRLTADIQEQLTSFLIEGNDLRKAFERGIKEDRNSLANTTQMVRDWHKKVESYLKLLTDRSYAARFGTRNSGITGVPNGMPSKYGGIWDLLQDDLRHLKEFVSEG